MENIPNAYYQPGGDNRQAPAAVAGAPPKKSILGGCASWVGANSTVAVATIAVLILIIVVLIVYYRGIWILGPFNTKAAQKPAPKDAPKDALKDAPRDAPRVERKEAAKAEHKKTIPGDEENRRLIDSINSAN